MKIGFTERGDGGRDISWVEACQNHTVDGVVVVTKTLTRQCGNAILDLQAKNFPVVLHATCTGWGGTTMEPGNWPYEVQLNSVKRLIDAGFPSKNVVVRIDPIIPNNEGLVRAENVIQKAAATLPKDIRYRMSVIDEYAHAKARMRARGIEPCYPDGQFYASPEQFAAVARMLARNHAIYGMTFETCAEPELKKYLPEGAAGTLEETGCLSHKDLDLMGLESRATAENGQNRHGCKCLRIKQELLSCKHPCKSACAYCYWQD